MAAPALRSHAAAYQPSGGLEGYAFSFLSASQMERYDTNKKTSKLTARKIPLPKVPCINSNIPKTDKPSIESAIPNDMACLMAEGCAVLEKKEITAYPIKNIEALRAMIYAVSFPSAPNNRKTDSGIISRIIKSARHIIDVTIFNCLKLSIYDLPFFKFKQETGGQGTNTRYLLVSGRTDIVF